MIKPYKISADSPKELIEASEALKKAGFGKFANCYFDDEENSNPYFQIDKPFTKDNNGSEEPDVEPIYFHVTGEYVIYTSMGWEYFPDLDFAIQTLKELYDESLVDLALYLQGCIIRFYAPNRGDLYETLQPLVENLDFLANKLIDGASCVASGATMHTYSEVSFPYNLQITVFNKPGYIPPEVKRCFISNIVGHYPEVFPF